MLRTRVITALVMLLVFSSAVFLFSATGWMAFVAVITGCAAWEWAGFCRWQPSVRYGYGVATAVAAFVLAYCVDTAAPSTAYGFHLLVFGVSILFWGLIGSAWLARMWPLGQGARAALTGLVVMLPTAIAMVFLRQINPWWLLGAMAIVWVADIAAYFSGRALGRRKLAPSISPGKSWEGVYGALMAVVAYGLIVLSWSGARFSPAAWGGIVLGLLALTGVSVVGDLFESMLKRQAGIKDSSQLLPGHGGVLDRIDSLTSTLPMVALFVLLTR
ncbi:phosphatidate cytidylyltransferase [Nitrogeniibacter mangrovi]|uniref:Phosphatidate cytidylyltransferase n=1 Tax=Nitrogeniibacter mangrovi TaxID=2016596 RepID=A0A6C1B5Q1_9RHOO|nr:phosphatidate cytidylyltransferase [Nitrogeniibacter mangrovi]QID18028.1 phosphatidate cytidylyltransferase [Nitrogeniibacter mangrovi]